jgi:hypothetical protein
MSTAADVGGLFGDSADDVTARLDQTSLAREKKTFCFCYPDWATVKELDLPPKLEI